MPVAVRGQNGGVWQGGRDEMREVEHVEENPSLLAGISKF